MFDDIQEFIDNCDIGHEFEFDYKGIGYGIGWAQDQSGKIIAYRKDAYGYYEQLFDTAVEMLDGFIIDGKPLRSVLPLAENAIMF